MSTETLTMPPYPSAAEENVWLQALHAVQLCQQVAELAARVQRLGSGGKGGLGWPSVAPASAASSAG